VKPDLFATDLGLLYKERMGIEEMFRDCKTGGYDIEGTSLKKNRLINLILLMTKNFKGGTSPRINPWNQSQIENRKSSSPRIYPCGQSKI
jgi:hypothetical protein